MLEWQVAALKDMQAHRRAESGGCFNRVLRYVRHYLCGPLKGMSMTQFPVQFARVQGRLMSAPVPCHFRTT